MQKLNDLPLVSILLAVLAIVVVLAGAIVTIVRPSSLSFHDYVLDVTILVAALGLGAGIGRGAIGAAKAANADVTPTADPTATTPTPTPLERTRGDAPS